MSTPEVKVSGHVRISELLQDSDVPSVMYRRDGILYEPVFVNDRIVDRFGRPVVPGFLPGLTLHDSHNLITTLGRQRVAELIGGLSAAFIDRIAVGDGGLFEGTSTPIPPRNDQTELVHELVRLERKTVVVDVDIPSVTFVGIFKNVGSYQFLQPGVAQVSEVGLLTPDNVLCAVYDFAPVPVDVHRLGFMVEWEWGVK
jgi:hypothetical protein